MPIPLTPGTPISFDQINDDLGVSPNQTTLDLETAGIAFGLDLDTDNWSDSTIGLSMDEFRGGGPVSTAATITHVPSPGYAFQSPSGLFTQPGTVPNSGGPTTSIITAGPHTIQFGVTSNGNYVIYNGVNRPTSPISPTSGVNGSPPTDNLHTITIPAIPYTWDSEPNVPTSPYSVSDNASSFYNGFFHIQDKAGPTPTGPATVLDTGVIRRMYNDKDIDHQNITVPYAGGTYETGYIDWKFGSNVWSLTTTSPPTNPLPTTAGWVTAQSKGTAGSQPSTSNFLRVPISVTVTTNPSPTTARSTQIFAFVPSTYIGTPIYNEMNTGGGASPSTGFYYPITITQPANPASAPTMTYTPSTIALDYTGDGVPVSLNVTPDSKTYSVSIVGPQAPNFSFTPTPSPRTGDSTITVSATEYSGDTPRTATLRTIIPAPNPVDTITTDAPITQDGISLQAGGYLASSTAPFDTPTDPAPHLGQPAVTWQIKSNSPPNTPWTVTKSPWITIPVTSGTGTKTDFSYTVTPNPSANSRDGNVTVDFDLDGTPYKVVRPVSQDATPFEPEFAMPSPASATEYFNATSNPTKSVVVDTNVPFSIGFTGDTAYWDRVATPTVPATQTNVTVPFGSPTTYTISYKSTDNDDYEFRNSTVTITSPVSPGTYTKNYVLNRLTSAAYLNFQLAGPAGFSGTGAFTAYTPTPDLADPTPSIPPTGGQMSIAGGGGTFGLDIVAHPNLQWNMTIIHPHPHPLVTSNDNTSVIGTNPPLIPRASGTGPGTWTGTWVTAPTTSPRDYAFDIRLNRAAPDVSNIADRVVGIQPHYTEPAPEPEPEPEPTPLTLTLSDTSYSAPRLGGSKVFGATGDAPFSKSIPTPISPWVSVSPTGAQTAGPAVSPTTFTVTVSAQPTSTPQAARSGTISIPSPAGNKSISVSQSENQKLTLTPSSDVTNIPNAGATYTFTVSGGGAALVTSPAPWLTANPTALIKTATGDKTFTIEAAANPTSPGNARNFDVTINTPTSSDGPYTINFAQLSNIPVPAYTAITLRVTAVESNACSGLAASFSGYVDGGSFANATTIYTNQSGTKYSSRNGASVWFSNSTIRRQWNDSTKTLGAAVSC